MSAANNLMTVEDQGWKGLGKFKIFKSLYSILRMCIVLTNTVLKVSNLQITLKKHHKYSDYVSLKLILNFTSH